MSRLLVVKLTNIVEPTIQLRTVDTASEKFMGIVESIRENGLYNPFSVRSVPREDGDDNPEEMFSVVDGFHRYMACKAIGIEEIGVNVLDLEEGQLLAAQIMANVHKVDTRPVEYSRGLLQILQNDPTLTKAELGDKLSKSPTWIGERLGLLNLTEAIGQAVDRDEIQLSNAYALARLPDTEQADFADRAMSMPSQQFVPIVNARLKELRQARSEGRKAGDAKFTAVPLLRGKAELVGEMTEGEIGPALCEKMEITTVAAAFALAVAWTLQMDPVSQQLQEEKDAERKAERKAANEAQSIERKREQAKKAAEKAAKLAAELEVEEKAEATKVNAAAEAAEAPAA